MKWWGFLFWWAVSAQAANTSLENFLKSPEWGSYVDCVVSYQRSFPGLYPSLELTRLDRLPLDEFLSQARHFAREWVEVKRRSRNGTQSEIERRIGQEANESLDRLIKKNRPKAQWPALQGSSSKLLKALPSNARTALSPLDAIFASSEIGQKVARDIASRPDIEVQAFTYDERNRRMTFEGTSRKKEGIRGLYELEFKSSPENDSERIRGTFIGESQPASADLVLQRKLIGGTFLNPQDSSSLPFGAYPKAKELWFENGRSHFSGDGHNHAH